MISNPKNDDLTKKFLENAKFIIENKNDLKIDMKEYYLDTETYTSYQKKI